MTISNPVVPISVSTLPLPADPPGEAPIYHVASRRILDATMLRYREGEVTLTILQERIRLDQGTPVTIYTPVCRKGSIEETLLLPRSEASVPALYLHIIEGNAVEYTPYRAYDRVLDAMVPVFSHDLAAMLSYAREHVRRVHDGAAGAPNCSFRRRNAAPLRSLRLYRSSLSSCASQQ